MARSTKSLSFPLARKLSSASASDIKKIGWRGILELAENNDGQLTVTSYARPQAVILMPEVYEALVEKARKQDVAVATALETLSARFDEQLSRIEGSEGASRLRKAIASSPDLGGKVKAGESH